jgi:uncharacterized protein YjbI with pentapeptide repeats
MVPEYKNHLADLSIKDEWLAIERSSHLLNCTFIDCKFTGSMDDVFTNKARFINCTFHDITFTNCDFIGAEFDRCNFIRCKSVSSTTTQSELRGLFTIVGDTSYSDDRDGVVDSKVYSLHLEVVSGTRYATLV